VTHKPPAGADGSTLIPSWFTLPVEAHISNNTYGPLSEKNSTDVNPSSTTISTLDSVEASKKFHIVASRDVEGKSYLDMT